MIQSPMDVLSLSGEAALCTVGSQIQFANASACALLGRDMTGRSVRELFGEELSMAQSPNFIADFTVGGRRLTGRFSRLEKGYLVFLSPESGDPTILNDPLLFSLRSSLMNMGIAADALRTLAEREDSEALRRNTVSLTNSYYRLLRQVENAGFVLGLFKHEAALNACACDVDAICRDAVEALQPFFPAVELEFTAQSSGRIVADPALFKLMLNNLLANCLIHASCSHIRIRLSETPKSLLLSVTDDGRGIPPEQLHQTFDRYRYRFDALQMGMGPGLGMSAARGVAELHGGTLLLESRLNRGTAVRVTLSRNLRVSGLRAEDAAAPYSTRDLLVGLADCLPEEAFTEKYLD